MKRRKRDARMLSMARAATASAASYDAVRNRPAAQAVSCARLSSVLHSSSRRMPTWEKSAGTGVPPGEVIEAMPKKACRRRQRGEGQSVLARRQKQRRRGRTLCGEVRAPRAHKVATLTWSCGARSWRLALRSGTRDETGASPGSFESHARVAAARCRASATGLQRGEAQGGREGRTVEEVTGDGVREPGARQAEVEAAKGRRVGAVAALIGEKGREDRRVARREEVGEGARDVGGEGRAGDARARAGRRRREDWTCGWCRRSSGRRRAKLRLERGCESRRAGGSAV